MLHWDYHSARDADLLRSLHAAPLAEARPRKERRLRLVRPMRRRRASAPARVRVLWLA
jgi:hypothetical protein